MISTRSIRESLCVPPCVGSNLLSSSLPPFPSDFTRPGILICIFCSGEHKYAFYQHERHWCGTNGFVAEKLISEKRNAQILERPSYISARFWNHFRLRVPNDLLKRSFREFRTRFKNYCRTSALWKNPSRLKYAHTKSNHLNVADARSIDWQELQITSTLLGKF